MKYIKLTLLLLLVLVGGNSCQKEKLVGEYYFTPEMRAKIPFKGYETIIFKTDSTDLVELNAANRRDTIYKSAIDKYESDYILWESDNIYFSNQNYKMSLHMNRYVFWHEPRGIVFDFVYLDSNYIWSGVLEFFFLIAQQPY
jgi:hypothetical protein